jgi:hypothetical protein
MDLQTTFYIVAIVYMAIMLIILLALLVAVLVIRAKITALENTIKTKLGKVTDIATKATSIFAVAKSVLRR